MRNGQLGKTTSVRVRTAPRLRPLNRCFLLGPDNCDDRTSKRASRRFIGHKLQRPGSERHSCSIDPVRTRRCTACTCAAGRTRPSVAWIRGDLQQVVPDGCAVGPDTASAGGTRHCRMSRSPKLPHRSSMRPKTAVISGPSAVPVRSTSVAARTCSSPGAWCTAASTTIQSLSGGHGSAVHPQLARPGLPC
jgi:hypothetical protein